MINYYFYLNWLFAYVGIKKCVIYKDSEGKISNCLQFYFNDMWSHLFLDCQA